MFLKERTDIALHVCLLNFLQDETKSKHYQLIRQTVFLCLALSIGSIVLLSYIFISGIPSYHSVLNYLSPCVTPFRFDYWPSDYLSPD